MLMTEASKEGEVILDQVPCIHYPVWFKKYKIKALINFGSKINTITFAYASKLGLKVCLTNIATQKIDSSIVKTF